jgi:DNA-binding PadR family transcriptional regulator
MSKVTTVSARSGNPDYLSRTYWNGTIKMSLSKFFILHVLHHKPMHGYDVSREVEKTTNGCCSPTEGTIYPVLREFEAGGYLTSEHQIVSGRERKVYALTERGRAAFKVAVESWMEITSSLAASESLIRDGRSPGDCWEVLTPCGIQILCSTTASPSW